MAKKEIKEEVKLEESAEETKVEETKVEEVEETKEAQPEVEEKPAEVVEETKEEVVEAPKEEVTETKEEDEKEAEVVQASEDVNNKILELEMQLAEANRKLSDKEADSSYKVLLSEGKVVPSQKEAYLKLHTAMKGEIELSDGSKEDMQVVLSEFFKNAPKIIELGESNTIEVSDDPNDEVKVAKAQIKALPVHAKKTDAEFDAYFDKNKDTILKSLKK